MAVVDVRFPVSGDRIPVDHGYLLFSAVSKILPQFHGNGDFGLHPISGMIAGDRTQLLSDKSCIKIRLPSDAVAGAMPLPSER